MLCNSCFPWSTRASVCKDIRLALDPDARKKENKIIETLLKYDVELYKIDVDGYEDVGSMPREVFQERKQKARFIDREDYLLMNLLSAV